MGKCAVGGSVPVDRHVKVDPGDVCQRPQYNCSNYGATTNVFILFESSLMLYVF
jgi:hypothetical protein